MTTLTPTTPLAIADVPVTLGRAKSWLGVTHHEDDALLSGLLVAVTEAVESLTGLALSARSYVSTDTSRSGSALYVLDLPRRPVASVESVTTLDAEGASTALASGTDYLLDVGAGGSLRFPGALARTPGGTLRIAFTTAAPTVIPEAVSTAILRGVATHYEWRTDLASGGASALPDACVDLLLPHLAVSV